VYVVDQFYSDRTSLISYVEVFAAIYGSLFLYVKHLTFYFLLSQRIFYFLKRKFVAVTLVNCSFMGGN